ncbi:MAG: hypothetical protein ABR909_10860 [Candidatus Bathyarchaeia archaeon]|jgi:hypothetical protein
MNKIRRERVREVWLVVWGIFIAFFIQVVYDEFGHDVKFLYGISISCIGLVALAISAKYLFSEKKEK